MPDSVDHPQHYNALDVECIDVVEHFSFNVGNAMKYLWRCEHKGAALEDLRKAEWYVQREIERLQVEQAKAEMRNIEASYMQDAEVAYIARKAMQAKLPKMPGADDE